MRISERERRERLFQSVVCKSDLSVCVGSSSLRRFRGRRGIRAIAISRYDASS